MMTRTKREFTIAVLRTYAFELSTFALVAFLAVSVMAAQKDLPRNALWEIVHNVCVPGQSQQHNPKPCLQVDLQGGIEKGFAILKDPRGAAQFLLTPTTRISGIESPAILGEGATNYFANAWEARTLINAVLGRMLPRDGIGLAINSVVSRSQDQLHIHVACVRADVLKTLRASQGTIGNEWAPLGASLSGRRYAAIWVSGEDLSAINPFRLLAEKMPGAARDMGNRTLVVVGLTRPDGTKGFVVLAGQVNRATDDWANGEKLLDQACGIATAGK